MATARLHCKEEERDYTITANLGSTALTTNDGSHEYYLKIATDLRTPMGVAFPTYIIKTLADVPPTYATATSFTELMGFYIEYLVSESQLSYLPYTVASGGTVNVGTNNANIKFTGTAGTTATVTVAGVNFTIGNVAGSFVWDTTGTPHTFTLKGEVHNITVGSNAVAIRWDGFGSFVFSVEFTTIIESSSSSLSSSSSSSTSSTSSSSTSSKSVSSNSSSSVSSSSSTKSVSSSSTALASWSSSSNSSSSTEVESWSSSSSESSSSKSVSSASDSSNSSSSTEVLSWSSSSSVSSSSNSSSSTEVESWSSSSSNSSSSTSSNSSSSTQILSWSSSSTALLSWSSSSISSSSSSTAELSWSSSSISSLSSQSQPI